MTASAMPMARAGADLAATVPVNGQGLVQKAQYSERRRGGYSRHYRGARHWRHHHSHRRHHYRHRHRHSDAWIAPGAFIAGALIGSALSQPRYPAYRSYGYSRSHVDWCYSRYRSYRASDNSFQPYHGPRRECRSPYY
ncbi:BA14K family protein [Mesorhizobium sp. J18]|uniref:BA14K family protein n=1 Tax=Mesorhizobium sp. J18 TaxID=935263 RepID=UPI0011A29E79|nr:BA14K family protein [Mesorhizobium sp. J18]